jgi:hypothetical protein
MSLLKEALRAAGGLDRWYQLQRFTVHVSMAGSIFARRGWSGLLKDLVIEGSTKSQSLQITGFTAPDRCGFYCPDRVTIEGSDGKLLGERDNPRAAFSGRPVWNHLHLAYYCGYSIWNCLTVPFILADPDFQTEELPPWHEDGEIWRRLKVAFPSRIATHSTEQIFYFDRSGFQRRVDYTSALSGYVRISQYSWAHQRFSGILVPTLYRSQCIDIDAKIVPMPVVLDLEIFDASFV